MATETAGICTRMSKCDRHNREYPELFFPTVKDQQGFWTGLCPGCEDEAKLEQRIVEYLMSQKDEIASEATKTILEREHQTRIAKRAKKDLAEDLAQYEKERLPLWTDHHANREWNEIVCEIEDRKRTEFLSRFDGQVRGAEPDVRA
ncbi:MAG: hypothetical protein WB460_15125 [Candidatus Acidiferrales bacterium]